MRLLVVWSVALLRFPVAEAQAPVPHIVTGAAVRVWTRFEPGHPVRGAWDGAGDVTLALRLDGDARRITIPWQDVLKIERWSAGSSRWHLAWPVGTPVVERGSLVQLHTWPGDAIGPVTWMEGGTDTVAVLTPPGNALLRVALSDLRMIEVRIQRSSGGVRRRVFGGMVLGAAAGFAVGVLLEGCSPDDSEFGLCLAVRGGAGAGIGSVLGMLGGIIWAGSSRTWRQIWP